MIFVKPIEKYMCEILAEMEDGALQLPFDSREEFESVLGVTKKFDNNEFLDMTSEEMTEKNLFKLRTKRKYLLIAFDKWEKAVLRGREQEDNMINMWYQLLLDLNVAAFENVPDRIKYYL